jgi:hypothetical protein
MSKVSEYRTNLNQRLEKSMYGAVETVRCVMREMDKVHGTQGTFEYSVEPTQCHA